jgi:hypothetical protein
MNAATKISDATRSGRSDAACVTTTPPMLNPTSTAGSGRESSTSQTRPT